MTMSKPLAPQLFHYVRQTLNVPLMYSLAPFRVRPTRFTTSPSLSSNIPVEEETIPDYDREDIYPANPGDLLYDRYEVIAKLGWGRSSIIWLARDMIRSVLNPITVGIVPRVLSCIHSLVPTLLDSRQLKHLQLEMATGALLCSQNQKLPRHRPGCHGVRIQNVQAPRKGRFAARRISVC